MKLTTSFSLLVTVTGLFTPSNSLPQPERRAPHAKKLVSYADAFSGNFSVSRTNPEWISSDTTADGTYVYEDPKNRSLLLRNILTEESSTFVDATKLGIDYHSYSIQPSQEHVLFSANYTQQYRYSFFADYFIYSVATGVVTPLVEGQTGDIQYAGWAPSGDTIAFVRGNDLYIWTATGGVKRITTDGGADVFNGVPDWVYEEEIFGTTKTLWFSPDSEYLAFLRFNETGVPTYTIPYYMAGQTKAPTYPRELDLRYPKVGAINPTVTFHLLDLSADLSSPSVERVSFESFAPDDLIISEVAWVTDTHSDVIFRTMNRVQDLEKLVLVTIPSSSSSKPTSKIVRSRDGTDGWIDNQLAIKFIPNSSPPSYLDLSDRSGWNHIYRYTLTPDEEPLALTEGEWEVTSIVKVDTKREKVYYISTERDSTERHLYVVDFDGTNKASLVDTTKEGVWGASFSGDGGYYVLNYNGPGIPYQQLYSVEDTTAPIQTLNDNSNLTVAISEYNLPKISWTTLDHPSGFSLNLMERLPANFNPNKKYPILFKIYGGPKSQETIKTYRGIDWLTYISSDPELSYIVLTVDNRGTGGKGRDFRKVVAKQLGKLEAEDQIWAAEEYVRTRKYADGQKVAIWGWSFGGYLTAKVAEKDSGVFTLGLSTAPVSDWRFYDSMYTERYMKSISTNAEGYAESAVSKSEGFKNIVGGFLVQHGTGDDNVHFQNTAALVDMLTLEGVSPLKLQTQFFTDNDHSMGFHKARAFLYKQLTERLYEEKERKGVRGGLHQWSKRHDGVNVPLRSFIAIGEL
ncbi:Dipeptidyl peptidase 4 [Rhizina undulata]